MENITLFVSIVIIVFGVLQIILFFKLWGMTSNVKRIKDNIINGLMFLLKVPKKNYWQETPIKHLKSIIDVL